MANINRLTKFFIPGKRYKFIGNDRWGYFTKNNLYTVYPADSWMWIEVDFSTNNGRKNGFGDGYLIGGKPLWELFIPDVKPNTKPEWL